MTVDYIFRREMDKVLDLLTPGNRLVMQVAIHTGLRVGDVLALKRAQIGRQFWVTEAKTGKKRRVNLPERLVEQIMAHSRGSVWAFPGGGKSGHRTRQAVWVDVKRASKAFRMPENVGTHTARKAFAVELMRRYGDIGRVQRALNHSDAGTTMLYAMADILTTRRLEARQKRLRSHQGIDD